MVIIVLVSIIAVFVTQWYNFSLPEIGSVHQIYFSVLGILISLLLANTERKRMTLVEKLSVFASSVISLAIAYDQRPPVEKNTDEKKIYFADWLKILVWAFKDFLESTTQGNLDLYTISSVDLDDALDALSRRNEAMRSLGVPANEISRASQYVNKIADTIEFVRLFKFYTTSRLLRYFLTILLVIGVIVFAPYYVTIPTVWIFVWPLFSCIFSAALNIQMILDNPVNGTGYIDQMQTQFTSSFFIRIQEILFDDDSDKQLIE